MKKRINEQELSNKLDDLEEKAKCKLELAEINRERLKHDMFARQSQLKYQSTKDTRVDAKKYSGIVSKSSNAKNQKELLEMSPMTQSLDGDVIRLQMFNIEKKIGRANEKREVLIYGTLEKQSHYQMMVDRALV